MKCAFTLTLVAVALGGSVAPRALQNGDRPAFEVASLKPNTMDPARAQNRGISFSPSGRVAWTSVTLRELMRSAYARTYREMDRSGPPWIDTDRFDIVATAPDALRLDPDGFPQRLFLMLRTLLEERFRLQVHVETRERPVYALRIVSRNGKLGPQLHRSDVDCAALLADAAQGRRPATQRGQPPSCSARITPGHITARSVTLAQVSDLLSSVAGRVVVDRTSLDGVFDLELEYSPELGADDGIAGHSADRPPNDAPSIVTALQEQLGLGLESTRAPVDVLVVDRAEKPTVD